MDSFLTCPRCGSHHIVKNGSIHNKKRKYKCQECNRQFIENPTRKIIDDNLKKLTDILF